MSKEGDSYFDFGQPESLTIFDVEEMESTLQTEIDKFDKFKIDLANIKEIDSAGIQWLAHFKWITKKQNKQASISNVNDLVQENTQLLNIAPILEASIDG